VDRDRALRTEFRQALDDVLPPAPWLQTSVREGLREQRHKRSLRTGALRPLIVVRLPRFSQNVAAAALIVVLLAAVLGVFLVTHRQANQSVPAGLAPPQAMPSGTQDLKAGTYAFAFPQLDAPGKPFPKALITVPDGWSINGGFALAGHRGSPAQLGLTIWDVVDVYANGCHWAGPMIHPGATADELAAVLAARPLRNATAPVAVSLGGYQGKYLQWSVPSDIRFDAASHSFSDCDIATENGVTAGYFKSCTDDTCDRFQQGPGQVDRLWILDIDGHRLLIDANYMPAATEQDRTELAEVVSSIVFKR